MTHKRTTKKLNPENYINKDTGETLTSEIPDIKSVNVVDEDVVIVNSDEYVIIDSAALTYIRENFSPTDLGRIMKMTDMTYGEYNVLYNGVTPHTTVTLMEDLEYSRNKFANFMKRLHMKSIIYYLDGYVDGKKKRHIMLNPHLARKRKTFNKQCINVFQDIKKLK